MANFIEVIILVLSIYSAGSTEYHQCQMELYIYQANRDALRDQYHLEISSLNQLRNSENITEEQFRDGLQVLDNKEMRQFYNERVIEMRCDEIRENLYPDPVITVRRHYQSELRIVNSIK